jgi:hypothetical protein
VFDTVASNTTLLQVKGSLLVHFSF